MALKHNSKSARTIELLGCSIFEFRKYLEKQFLNGMKWRNYGVGMGKWNMDHIIPCSIFDFSDPSEQRQCFHFTNVRPLWDLGSGGNRNKLNRTYGLKLLYNNSTPFLK